MALDAAQESLTLPDRIQHIVANTAMISDPDSGRPVGRPRRALLSGDEGARARRRPGFFRSLDIINFVARMLIWSLLILLALDNLGVNITALLAGLGVGGVAVALARKMFSAICLPRSRSRSTSPL